MNDDTREETGLEIAVIGMAGRFPEANNISKLWENLCAGKESIRFFSQEEFSAYGLDEKKANTPGYIAAHGVLDGYDNFDADFFGYTPMEAEIMDPQHRVFLECVWTGLETAGYNPFDYEGAIGLVASSSQNGYKKDHVLSNAQNLDLATEFQANISNNNDFLTTRVSYKLNLTGPSITVQSACSSSLVAIHLACQQLMSGDCDIAVAGGVSITMPESWGYQYQEGMIFSPDGHCRAFDQDAQGTLKGDGVAVVILKRLEDAINDGDNIDAVILASAINNDGSQKIGYTAPSIKGQADVIRSAQLMAEVAAETIQYIEAHGTGTPLGDPIEVEALAQVFSEYTEKKQFCRIGSIKTNIGHLDAAAGIAGFIKATLCVKNNKFVPSINFTKPNQKIDFLNSPVKVSTDYCDWAIDNSPRRAGISSFGIGGTNAHIIIEQAPLLEDTANKSQGHYLIPVSAHTKESLNVISEELNDTLLAASEHQYSDIAYMAQCKRKSFNYRRAYIVSTGTEQLVSIPIVHASELSPEKVFLFPGQGAQYLGMGKYLYESEPIYKKWIDYCCDFLQTTTKYDFRQLILNTADESNRLQETQYTQPAIFITEYALAQLWAAYGIEPDVVIGHSLGEITAACIAGVFSLDDALGLIQLRAKLMQQQPRGGMLSVPLLEKDVVKYLDDKISLAAVNGPKQCVISGDELALNAVKIKIESENQLKCVMLKTSHAFHSSMMDSVVKPFVDYVRSIKLHPSKFQIISSVLGRKLSTHDVLSPQYWGKNIRDTVRFNDAIQEVITDLKTPLFIESGPGTTLTGLVKNSVKDERVIAVASLRHPKEIIDDTIFFYKSIATCWCNGVELDWEKFSTVRGKYYPLPNYRFTRKRYWRCRRDNNIPQVIHGRNEDEKKWLFTPSWERGTAISNSESAHFQANNLVVISNSHDMVSKILDSLAETSVAVTIAGLTIEKQEGRATTQLLDMRQKEIVDNFIESQRYTLNHIIIDINNTDKDSYLVLLFLLQALDKFCAGQAIKIDILTQDAFDVFGDEKTSVSYAPVVALKQTIQFEYPEYQCRHIDYYQDNKAILIDELFSKPFDSVIALRNKYRWIPKYKTLSIPESTALENYGEEVCLITGGLGNLGLLLAEHISKDKTTCFALISRSKFPERGLWEQLLGTDEDQNICSKIKTLLRIENTGAKTLILQADISNFQQTKEVVSSTVEYFGKITSVIHAAGIVDKNNFKPLIDLTASDFVSQAAPKSIGLQSLNRALKGMNLKYAVTFSSIAAIMGGLGYTAYAAANIAMDMTAENNEEEREWFSINWDGWKLTKEDSYEFSIEKEQGLRVFDQILTVTKPQQIIVSTGELNTRLEDILHEKDKKAIDKDPLEAEIDENHIAPGTEIEQSIANIWHEILGLKAIGIEDNFFELGGDSLVAIRVISRLRLAFSMEFPANVLFEAATIKLLASYIKKHKGYEENRIMDKQAKIADLKANIAEMTAEEIRALIKKKSKNKSDNAS